MDEFGVLTERYGLKPQGKSTPLAALKRNVNNNNEQNWNLGMDSNLKTKSSSESNSVVGAYLDSLHTNGSMGTPNNGHLDPYDDIFGGPVNPPMQTVNVGGGGGGGSGSFDYDSIFSGSNTNGSTFNSYGNDDIFGGMPGLNSSSSVKSNVNNKDIFGTSTSSSKQSAPIDDLLGGFSRAEATPKTSYGNRSANGVKNASNFDDFIPGFGGSNSPNSGNTSKHPQKPISQPNKATSTLLADPFEVLESASPLNSSYASDFYPLEQMSKLNNTAAAKPPRLKSPPKGAQVMKSHKVKSSRISSIDELEDFAMGRGQNNAKGRLNVRFNEEGVKISANKSSRQNGDDLESFFSMGSRSNSVPKSRTTTLDPLFDAHTKSDKPGPTVPQMTSFGTSTGIKKSSSSSGLFDDLSSMFGAAQVFGEFEEVEGESEERRRARLGRLQRTQERALKAVADMNQRDMQSQQEQEERRRIAESVDIEIKRWAAGKEGNMRALLSSLHFVLWPECGWQPVSLTDLITSTSVKKVYRKANLCVHPDKVQQKGATLQQKYTAEKVFDILKETWTKFNAEELR